jgi:hypothetical protein
MRRQKLPFCKVQSPNGLQFEGFIALIHVN